MYDLQQQMDDLRHRLTNHPPTTAEVATTMDLLTAKFLEVGNVIIGFVPDGREKSLALTNLEQMSMWAKAGVARNQKAVAS